MKILIQAQWKISNVLTGINFVYLHYTSILRKFRNIPNADFGPTRGKTDSTWISRKKVNMIPFVYILRQIILNLLFMVKHLYYKNVCEFTEWILIIVNKRKNMKNHTFCINNSIDASLLTLLATWISLILLIDNLLSKINDGWN